ncbi:MAG: DUF4870 domain-containing protein [Pseudomonadota bacterium]
MSDQSQISVDPNTQGNANLIYILYLLSIAVGLTALVGVIMAYIGKDGASPTLTSHYDNQINIFWKGLLYSLIGLVLTFVIIGIVVLLATLIWYIVRCVKGMQALSRGEPVPNPGSWGF